MRLQGKVALVTGGASGFGQGIAELFAREGARVAIADLNEQAARKVAATMSNDALAVRCDVSRRGDVDATVKATVERFQTIDILINNAGTTHVRRPMLEVDEAEFDRVMAVNVKSIFLFAHAVVPLMRERKSGVIINIGSTAGIRPRPGLTWYNASKGAVNLLSNPWRPSLRLTGFAFAQWHPSFRRRRCLQVSWGATRRNCAHSFARAFPWGASPPLQISRMLSCSWLPMMHLS
jgi:3-oxoacyl-[acyl-carrier protein] reductase